MIDHSAKFSPKGLKVEFVEEEQGDNKSTERVLKGKVQLVYISPESAPSNNRYRNMFLSTKYKESQHIEKILHTEFTPKQMWNHLQLLMQ